MSFFRFPTLGHPLTKEFLEVTSHTDKNIPAPLPLLPKPSWLRVPSPLHPEVLALRKQFDEAGLHTVCEEARCPNIGECFRQGTATFMILGNLCTRACPFCDVDHGKPLPPDPFEPEQLARAVARMGLRHVVVTSVDRDDLHDGGAGHFVKVIDALRALTRKVRVEILVPDFRGCLPEALEILSRSRPDIFNHNIETVPRLYRKVRPGADYAHSLDLLSRFSRSHPDIPTKSGIMLGVGEEDTEVLGVIHDLRSAGCSMLTLGQYLSPSSSHLPVERYVAPSEFARWESIALKAGFLNVAAGPLVRSSYHAEETASSVTRSVP